MICQRVGSPRDRHRHSCDEGRREVDMGGDGSSRWNATVTRTSTAGLPQLDVRALAREGCLRPSTVATVTWGNGASVTSEVNPDDADAVTLRYRTCAGPGIWRDVQQRIPLTTTPGRFGGVRRWFACPGCGGRCAVLYALAGVFRCRTCHRLAYARTRLSS
jgi:hypothetical protein